MEMAVDITDSTQRADPIEMEEIAQNIQFLPDTTLREIAKGPLVKFALSCPDNKYVPCMAE